MQLHYFPDLPVADRKENFTEIQPQLLKESDRKIRPTRSCETWKKTPETLSQASLLLWVTFDRFQYMLF